MKERDKRQCSNVSWTLAASIRELILSCEVSEIGEMSCFTKDRNGRLAVWVGGTGPDTDPP